MDQKQDPEAFYQRLKERLEEGFEWPHTYLYKFIMESSSHKVAEIDRIFDKMGAVISYRDSSKGKYISVTIEVEMSSPDHVIEKYKEVGRKVEGIISL